MHSVILGAATCLSFYSRVHEWDYFYVSGTRRYALISLTGGYAVGVTESERDRLDLLLSRAYRVTSPKDRKDRTIAIDADAAPNRQIAIQPCETWSYNWEQVVSYHCLASGINHLPDLR